MAPQIMKRSKKQEEIYRKLGQGIKVFHDPENAEVDILAVPGLGTNAVSCWSKLRPQEQVTVNGAAGSTNASNRNLSDEDQRSFNWITDPQGLKKTFPRARIMIYDYPSSWRPDDSRKVRATMNGICSTLLNNLQDLRGSGGGTVRPLVFIAHSMGGVVVAKALLMAKVNPEFESLVTCTMGCAFFGTPFRGTNMAKYAMMYNAAFGSEAYESLISFMRKERNDLLDDLTDSFMEVNSRLLPPIEITCIWEQVPTGLVGYSDKILGSLLQQNIFITGAKKLVGASLNAAGMGDELFVSKDASLFPGAKHIEIAEDHRGLVKFDSENSERYRLVISALDKMVQNARVNARRRTAFLGQKLLTQKFVNHVRRFLEGADMRAKFRLRSRGSQFTSWLTNETLYEEWLSNSDGHGSARQYLWLKGGPGLGKTNACLAAIQQLEKKLLDEERLDSSAKHTENFLAFYLCDSACSAEDVLKSLITQLIDQEESLAQHAKWFVPNPRYQGPGGREVQHASGAASGTGAKATATVENLWKCLQDMTEDPVVNEVHIIISNLHCLDTSESAHSTTEFLQKLRWNAFNLTNPPASDRRAKWLLTSRNDPEICEQLRVDYISCIDLEDNQMYGGKVKDARKKHAREVVAQLSSTKQYPSYMSYYVRNSIESQSEDENWIEVVCLLLRAMAANSRFTAVKRLLREVGQQKIHKLVDHAWTTILDEHIDSRQELEELLQILTISYEPPTTIDLAVLMHTEDIERLTNLVHMCAPVLKFGDQPGQENQVIFTHSEFAHRMTTFHYGSAEVSSSQKKQYHGMIALTCFEYIKSSYDLIDGDEGFVDAPESLAPQRNGSDINTHAQALDISNGAGEAEDMDNAVQSTTPSNCHYPIKYLFHHLAEGFPDVTQALFELDPDFWGQDSALRTAWLKDYAALTTNLKGLRVEGMNAIHVAAAIGANEVVSKLLEMNSLSALSWTSDEGKTALHVAAFNNQRDMVNLLIRQKASIEAGDGAIGTPLHFAALQGHDSVMDLLIDKNANVNAFSEAIGPVINAAIRSSNVKAVEKIMKGNVQFDFDYTQCDPPLSLSAGLSEPSLFRDILQTGKVKWVQNEKLIDQALNAAAYGGKLESVKILLEFPHVFTNETMQDAMLSAALEKKWSCVDILLDRVIKDTKKKERRSFQLGDVFYLACTCRDEQLDILSKIWSFTGTSVPRAVIDFSLYQTTDMAKEATVQWLLHTCEADANATAEQPSSLTVDAANIAPVADMWNAINAAARTGNVKIIQSLLDSRASLHGEKVYALQLAAKEGHHDAVDILLRNGADVDKTVADSGELVFHHGTALQAACDGNRVAVVETLMKYHVNPNLGGGRFGNPITAAAQKEEPEILKLLLNADGINVNVTGGEDESTPLINAATRMSKEIIDMLVQKGADIDARNIAGDTALIMAAARGDQATIELLCTAGADVTYRSPTRGLPITAASRSENPGCAHILAERMGGKIEAYRAQVDVDHPKQLQIAYAKLEEQNRTIETLQSRIVEKEEALEGIQRDFEVSRLQHQTFMSESSFTGQTYASVGEQIRAVRLERDELQRQLVAAQGQVQLARDTVNKIEGFLQKEKQKSSQLRQRFGYVALQEENEMLRAQLEEEKASSAQRAEQDIQHKERLEAEIDRLMNDILAMQEEINIAQTATKQADVDADLARQHVEAHKLEIQAAKAETKATQTKYEELQELLTKVQEATAAKSKAEAEAKATQPEIVERPSSESYFASTAQSPPVENTHMPSRNGIHSPTSAASSTPTPGGGFRSIHGAHRADGSFGGYKKNKNIVFSPKLEPQKPDHSSLYSNSTEGS